MLEKLRTDVYRGNMALPQAGLVTWTSGNVSGRDPTTGCVAIKPSGVPYESLTADDIVILDPDGRVLEGQLKPSVDAPTHLYVYRQRPDVHGIVHTHSTFATAFAALGLSIPVYLTAIADEFGGPIPIGAYAQIGEEEIGQEIVRSIGPSPAILMKNHGVFTVGSSVMGAVKAAVMTEDVARTVYYAVTLGNALHKGLPDEIPADEVRRGHQRYVDKYGQNAGGEKTS